MDWFLYDNSLRHKRVNYLIENLGNPFGNGLLDSYFFKMTLGTDCLKLYFWTVAFNLDSSILQKYRPLDETQLAVVRGLNHYEISP